MQQLPGRSLTKFSLSLNVPLGEGITAAAVALAGLTNLQSLSLDMCAPEPDRLLIAVSKLSKLTELDIVCGLEDASMLALVPQQLVGLDLWRDDERWHDTQPPQLLPLGHLTACTGLCTGPYHIKPEDVLPPNLQHLVIAGCPAAKPLLQLAKLESLVLDDFIPGAEMELLADALTRLTTMELGMQSLEAKVSAADVEVAARAWRRLPIDQLRLGEQLQLSAVSLQHVGQLHCLNWLDIDFADYDAFVDVLRPLTTALLQLRRLSTLQLSAGVGDVDMVINAQREALQQELCMFVQALGSLPWLSTLVCRGIGAGPSALVHLSAAKRLSDLVWYGDVTDFVLNTWAWSFQHLRRLIIRDASVTDAALPTIARTLKKLEDLDLSSTDVTNLGIQCLSALTSLSALRVIDTYVSHGVVERVLNSCALLRAPSVVLER